MLQRIHDIGYWFFHFDCVFSLLVLYPTNSNSIVSLVGVELYLYYQSSGYRNIRKLQIRREFYEFYEFIVNFTILSRILRISYRFHELLCTISIRIWRILCEFHEIPANYLSFTDFTNSQISNSHIFWLLYWAVFFF